MTKDEHNKLLNDIKNCTSDADRMNFIVQLERDYTGILSERDTATATAESATAESNKYAKLNNELWLENSSQKHSGKETKGDTTMDEETTEPAKRSFEELEKNF